MNLLFLAETFPLSAGASLSSSVEAYDWHMATLLARKHRVQVVTLGHAGDPSLQQMKGVTVHRIGRVSRLLSVDSWLSRLLFMRACRQYLPRLEYDAIHASSLLTQWITASLLDELPKPAVARVMTLNQGAFLSNTIEQSMLTRKSWSGIVTASQTVKEMLIQAQVAEDIISVIPLGTAAKELSASPVVKKKAPTICTVGRLYPYKRIDLLIQAVSLLKKRQPTLRLEIVGDGPERHSLERLVHKLRLEAWVSIVRMPTLHTHMIKHLKAARIFCVPTVATGLGTTLLEACACGTPYVTNDTPVTRELTRFGQGGLLTSSLSAEELAEKIDEMLSDSRLYNTKARESKRLAHLYDWSKTATKTEKLFRKISR